MNTTLKFGLAAAAVVAAVLVGINVLGSPSNVGGPGPNPNADSTLAPTPSPSIEPSVEPSVASGLPEGPHVLVEGSGVQVGITVTIDAPLWDGERGGGILIQADNVDPPDGVGLIVFPGPDDEYYVYGDPCDWVSTTPTTPATTVDEMVDALANQALRQASEPEDITVDGHAGKRIILTMADGMDFDACDDGHFGLFGEPGGSTSDDLWRYSQGPGQIEELWIVDVDGTLVVMDGVYYADSVQDAVDEMRAILASATFELP